MIINIKKYISFTQKVFRIIGILQVLNQIELMFVILKVISALFVSLIREILSDSLPIPPMPLQALYKLLFLFIVPLYHSAARIIFCITYLGLFFFTAAALNGLVFFFHGDILSFSN